MPLDRGEFDALLRERLDPFGALIRQLQGEVPCFVGDPGQPPFLNGWVNFGGSGQRLHFYRAGMEVAVMGQVKSGPTSVESPVFQLPDPKYFPAEVVTVPTISVSGTYTYLKIGTDGAVMVYSTSALFVGVSTRYHVNG